MAYGLHNYCFFLLFMVMAFVWVAFAFLIKVTVMLIFVLIHTVQHTSTTYLLLVEISSKMYVHAILVVLTYYFTHKTFTMVFD